MYVEETSLSRTLKDYQGKKIEKLQSTFLKEQKIIRDFLEISFSLHVHTELGTARVKEKEKTEPIAELESEGQGLLRISEGEIGFWLIIMTTGSHRSSVVATMDTTRTNTATGDC